MKGIVKYIFFLGMDFEEKAKQFMPFKAVTGLDEALERKRLELGLVEKRKPNENKAL